MATSVISIIIQILLAFCGGVLPVLIWLWYWEHEDKHPEPHKLTIWAFIGGMIAVIGVIPFEDAVKGLGLSAIGVYVAWAAIEEIAKFIAAGLTSLWRAENDEPIDSMMYLIVTALGFAAFENALYIIVPLLKGDASLVLVTLNLRFFGATLIHTICSSLVGFALAITYYRSAQVKRIYTIISLCIAIVLHSLFNLSIMLDIGTSGVIALYAVWLGFIAILLLFEKIKHITNSP
jgi:RsiW-degrading membrane proteinase PrsW (M82 family)